MCICLLISLGVTVFLLHGMSNDWSFTLPVLKKTSTYSDKVNATTNNDILRPRLSFRTSLTQPHRFIFHRITREYLTVVFSVFKIVDIPQPSHILSAILLNCPTIVPGGARNECSC